MASNRAGGQPSPKTRADRRPSSTWIRLASKYSRRSSDAMDTQWLSRDCGESISEQVVGIVGFLSPPFVFRRIRRGRPCFERFRHGLIVLVRSFEQKDFLLCLL